VLISAEDPGVAARADALHRRATVLLGHDHLWRPADFDGALTGGVTARIVHAFVDVEVWGGPEAFEATKEQEDGVARRAMVAFDRVLSYVEEHPEQTLLVRAVADIERAKATGRAGASSAPKVGARSKGASSSSAATTAWVCGTSSSTGITPIGSRPASARGAPRTAG
jgi:hypothetical protein